MIAEEWQRRAGIARMLVLSSYVALLLLVAVGTLILPTRDRAPNVTIWIIQSLPLLIVVIGIVRGGVIAHAWLSFISLLYFAMAVTELFVPPLQILDVLKLIFSIELFFGAMLYVRWRSRALRNGVVAEEVQ